MSSGRAARAAAALGAVLAAALPGVAAAAPPPSNALVPLAALIESWPHHPLPTRGELMPLAQLSARAGSGPERRRLWMRAARSARAYARGRRGRVSFALIDDRGRLHGYRDRSVYRSASLVKAMLLVASLRRREIRARPLSRKSHGLLGPMIRRSDNAGASRVRDIVGNAALARLSRRARMRRFATAPSWGDTALTARDQARFFGMIDRLVPPRHRGYALRLLSHIVTPQRWGIAAAAPKGVRLFFKGGWRPASGGWIVNQAALAEHGRRRISLAVLTDQDRSEGYGHETIRGIAARLLPVLTRP